MNMRAHRLGSEAALAAMGRPARRGHIRVNAGATASTSSIVNHMAITIAAMNCR
nr:hypothetical protein [Duganella lactea]